MLTVQTIIELAKKSLDKPHYFGQSSMPSPRRREFEQQQSFPPRTVIRMLVGDTSAWVVTPYVGEEMTPEEMNK